VIRCGLLFFPLVFAAAPVVAQPSAAAEPPLRRWFELQSLSVYTRYRFIESNTDVVSANDVQYKEVVRARFNIDARRRYTVNAGFSSGSTFVGSWDNTGLGIGRGDYHSHYLRQLFAAAAPVPGLQLQAGGLYITRGENTEATTYDDDGYVAGERISIRRPRQLYVDEVSVTRGALGEPTEPNLVDRWESFAHQHYTQVLATKRFSQVV
jgi:hypothetical protein